MVQKGGMRRILTTAFLLITVLASAQTFNITDRLYAGGGVGFGFSNDVLTYNVSPLVGYKFTDQLSAGLRFAYQHSRNNQTDDRFNALGFGPFARFKFPGPLFLHAEYEYLRFKLTNPTTDFESEPLNFSSVFLGGGLSQPISRNAAFDILILYNVLYDDQEFPRPYNSPFVVRAGISLGF